MLHAQSVLIQNNSWIYVPRCICALQISPWTASVIRGLLLAKLCMQTGYTEQSVHARMDRACMQATQSADQTELSGKLLQPYMRIGFGAYWNILG